jgi:hypothetical protein
LQLKGVRLIFCLAQLPEFLLELILQFTMEKKSIDSQLAYLPGLGGS